MPPPDRNTQSRTTLGTGWPFPVRPVAGRLDWVREEALVEQAIGLLLRTSVRERLMLPELGTTLSESVFAPNVASTHARIEATVRQTLGTFEPRIELERVAVRESEVSPTMLEIEIDYVVRRSNTFFNRVFPFHLREGG